MTGFSDVTLANAITSIIANLSPAIVPATTLTTAAAPGDTQIQIVPTLMAGVSRFLQRGWVVFDDGTGEETLDIEAVSLDGTTLTLDFTGLGYDGLQHAHDTGTLIYTNLDTDAPLEVAPALTLGDPVIAVMVTHQDDHWASMGPRGGVLPLYTAHLEYFRKLTLPPVQKMSANRWAKRQQQQARADLERIVGGFRANRDLVSKNAVAQAIGLGSPGHPMFARDWGRLARSQDMQIFVATLDMTVQGNFVS